MSKTQTWPEYLRRITGGLPPADIAKRSGIPLSTITRWLAGETKPSQKKVDQLSRFFPMKFDEVREVLASYNPTPRAQTANQVFAIGDDEFSRAELLRMFSDLELAKEFVRRIEEHDSVDAPRVFATESVQVGSETLFGTTFRVVPRDDVPARQQDYDIVANETINEFPDTNDTDYDHA